VSAILAALILSPAQVMTFADGWVMTTLGVVLAVLAVEILRCLLGSNGGAG
jgi:hypothetical protein